MKRKLLIVCVFLFAIKGVAQDSIVNYLDRKGKVTSKELSRSIETIVKKSDSLWEYSWYRKSGVLASRSYFKSSQKKKKIGQSIIYSREGKMISLTFFNSEGLKIGKHQTWFNNGSISSVGRYVKDKKEGIWKYYHFNGKLASKLYYKNCKVLKSIIFNEDGKRIDVKQITKKEAYFKGGSKKFLSKVKKITKAITYKMVGKIYVNFTVDIQGNIKNVNIENKLPEKLNNYIVAFFENIEGWSPMIHMNRKHPMNFSIPLNFRK